MRETVAPSPALVVLMAASCGLIVANIYYAQPLVGLIAPSVGIGPEMGSLIVTFTQLGYAAGLMLLVPLGDIVENRLLLTAAAASAIIPLLGAATAHTGWLFLAACGAIGVTSVAVQMLVPLAANLAPDHLRGRVVGNVMGGLLLGILLARPAASLVAAAFGWRAVFFASAGVMFCLVFVFRCTLPVRRPPASHSYVSLLKSLLALPLTQPVLRRRIIYHTAAFACFSLFWTGAPLLLAQKFGFGQAGIAGFALVGAAGALMAPVAGRLADRNFGRIGSALALGSITMAFLLAAAGAAWHSVGVLALAGVLLDPGVQANLVFSQRAIYELAPDMRARLNGIFMAVFFAGGATGSAVTSPLLASLGWSGLCALGAAAPLAALGYFLVAER